MKRLTKMSERRQNFSIPKENPNIFNKRKENAFIKNKFIYKKAIENMSDRNLLEVASFPLKTSVILGLSWFGIEK